MADYSGAFFQGFNSILAARAAQQRRALEERRLRLQENDEDRRRQIFDLNLQEAERRAQEQRDLPAASAALIRGAQPTMTVGQVVDDPEIRTGLNLAEQRQLSQRARSLPDLLTRLGAGGETKIDLVNRLAPHTFNLLALQTPEAVQQQDQQQARKQQSESLFRDAIGDITNGNAVSGFSKAAQAMQLVGQHPPFKELHDVVQDSKDLERAEGEGKRLGPLISGALGGDEQKAKDLVSEAMSVRSKGFKAFVPHLFQIATTALGGKVPPAAVIALQRFGKLHAELKDPIRAYNQLLTEDPKGAAAMQAAKLVPPTLDAAIKGQEAAVHARAGIAAKDESEATKRNRAAAIMNDTSLSEDEQNQKIFQATGLEPHQVRTGQKFRPEAQIKTLEAQALKVAEKTFPGDPIRQRAFSERLQKRLQGFSSTPSFKDIEKGIRDEIAAATGGQPQPDDAKKETSTWLDSIKGLFGGGKSRAAPAVPAATGGELSEQMAAAAEQLAQARHKMGFSALAKQDEQKARAIYDEVKKKFGVQ